MISSDRMAEWLSKLVQIPSVSPDQAGPRAGTPGEARLAETISGWFQDLGGHEVHVEEVQPGRPNVYGIWRGQSDRWVAVDVHMDTVSVEQMVGDPFDGRIENGRVYGRGAVDTKATLGIVLALLESMQQAGQKADPNLLIVATIDEEITVQGAFAFANWVKKRGLSLDQLVVAEPTMCQPVYGHKGVCRLEFDVQGKSTHTSQPQLGQNSIIAAAPLLMAMEEEHQRLLAEPPKTELGPPTLAVSIIQGGSGINVVPDSCRISIDRRIVAGENPAEVAAALRALAEESCPLPVVTEDLLLLDAFFNPPDTPWIQQLAAWSGQEPVIAPYGTNAFAYRGLARDCVVIGPGSIDQAHGKEEWVEIAQLEKMADIYARWWGVQS